MNSAWHSYPISSFSSAIRTVVGRILLTYLSISMGCGLGAGIVYMKGEPLIDSIMVLCGTVIVSPLISLPILASSIFLSYGILVLPLLLGFTIIYVRAQLKETFLLVALLLPIFLAYDVTYYAEYESPSAQLKAELNGYLEKK